MTIDELITQLKEIKTLNTESGFDAGSLEVRVQSNEGTYDSEILEVTQANDAWLIIDEPNYDI